MASQHTTVAIEKPIHQRLSKKLRNSGTDIKTVISRLVEMYLDGEVTVIIPPKKV